MYYYLGKKEQTIEGKKYYLISVLCHDIERNNFSVCRIYSLICDELETNIAFLNTFDDITEKISFKVRNDGKVVLTYKY